MVAGASTPRTQPLRLRIADYERRLRDERRRCADARPETPAVTALRAMDQWGWHLVEGARSPAGDRVDAVAVGPGGVLVLRILCRDDPDVVGGRLVFGLQDAQPELDDLCRRTDFVADLVATTGLAPTEVVPVVVLVGQRGTELTIGRVTVVDDNSVVPWAVARGPRLDGAGVAELVTVLDRTADDSTASVVTDPAPSFAPRRVGKHAEPAEVESFDADALEQAVLRHTVGHPAEPWMTWLHPDQLRLVRRRLSGASRIRGAAGTGKTVVALHRAAYMAEAVTGPILFTTFVTTLPHVLQGLYAQLSPSTADRIEFTDLHAWAEGLLRSRGHQVSTDQSGIDSAFERAWVARSGAAHLRQAGVTEEYCREEIDSVIKGRGITAFDDYATLRRVGRRIRLSAAAREAMWSVFTEYEWRLRDAGLADQNDMLGLARAELAERPLDKPYSAVIADEVQDLNCLAVRLLADIAGGGERLLLIGDGQQQIYPGGYTLAEAGVCVTGRSSVLQVNYRNPAAIARSALELVADQEWHDLDDAAEPGMREITTMRAGGEVDVEHLGSDAALRDAVVGRVWELLEAGHEAAGIAVLCATSAEADSYVGALRGCGLPVLPLDRYTGSMQQAIKVGTVRRAKGLEFADVIHPVSTTVSTAVTDSATADAEARILTMRTRYVAMTRARESVWLGSIA